jgi:hypothetical protein
MDNQLLQSYAVHGSEAAFRELGHWCGFLCQARERAWYPGAPNLEIGCRSGPWPKRADFQSLASWSWCLEQERGEVRRGDE